MCLYASMSAHFTQFVIQAVGKMKITPGRCDLERQTAKSSL